ncbi:hypothetical protein ACWGI9_30580 [Streptomyces sp. NPDC054833]
MTHIAAAWYESDTFWSISVGAVVAIATAALGAWATLRSASPKRRLTYCLRKYTSLLNTIDEIPSTLSVTHGTTEIANPHIAEVQLCNQGRRDITSTDFHNGEPIRFNFGAPVVAVLGIERGMATYPEPEVTHSDGLLSVGPSLLPRGQAISISVLLDGEGTEFEIQTALVDVRVTRQHEEEERVFSLDAYLFAWLCAGFFLILTAGLFFGYLRSQHDANNAWSVSDEWTGYAHKLEKQLNSCKKNH